tara:strand:+ start:284 stop:475 length:192 start_codon:yes stop_codon:yes gene_type:complete
MKQDILKRLHAIDTLFYNEGDITLTGLDEFGTEFSVTIPIFELLEWVNISQLKEEAIKYINEK